jgi:tetratricopeptide (TPR) repeat protein
MTRHKANSLLRVLFLVSFIGLSSAMGQTLNGETPTEVQAEPPAKEDFESLFSQGVKLYQEQKYQDAQVSFSKAISLRPHHSEVLANLGLTAFQQGQKGLALGYLRKSLNSDANNIIASNAIKYVEAQLEMKEIPREIGNLEIFKEYLIDPVSLNSYLGFLALCLFAFGWLWLDFLAELKSLRSTRSRLTEFPSLKVLISLFFLLSVVGTAWKIYENEKTLATIITKKVPLLSGPQEDAVQLLDLYEGLQVEVLKQKEDWLQVMHPGTPAGWVKQVDLFKTSISK